MQGNLFETNTIPNFTKPPLPFMGNKTKMLKTIKACLDTLNIPDDTIFLDVFGGSGLIAHNLKAWYPNARVIWNDFDNYKERLELMPITQEILEKINALNIQNQNKKRMRPQDSNAIKEILESYLEKDLDCITISSWLLFSGNYATTKEKLLQSTYYNGIPKTLSTTKGYLQGVERVSMDFREVLAKYKGVNVLPILDPPYLNTQKGNYKMHFTLKDFLNIFNILRNYPTSILFSSTKSENQEFLDYFKIPYQVCQKDFFLKADNKDLLFFIQQKVA